MKKKKFSFSDFSKKELDNLKEYYVSEKVKSMNESELRGFVSEIVSHQVKNTIGDEEEQEAWEEIENFFKDNFEFILEGVKKKFETTSPELSIDTQTSSSHVQEKNIDEAKNEKIDMWMD